jgi:bacterioferritin
MRKYMLILFSYGDLKKINRHLKKIVKKDDKLFVRAVLFEKVPKLSEHLISDEGVLGKKVVRDLENSVVDIYHDNARKYLEELKEMAAKNKFQLDTKLVDDHDLDRLKKEIKAAELDRVFINFSHNEYITDQVKEEEIKSWLKKIKLPQDIFYDGKKEK